MSKTLTPQERAEKSVRLILENDLASKSLGIELRNIGPGTATLSMTLTDRMMNGHGMCHGGYVFLLADTAFACACNSYNQTVVAQQNQITFLAPTYVGMTLSATAQELSVAGRSGIYDVVVMNDEGDQIALFRGLSRRLEGQHFPETEETP